MYHIVLFAYTIQQVSYLINFQVVVCDFNIVVPKIRNSLNITSHNVLQFVNFIHGSKAVSKRKYVPIVDIKKHFTKI